jgi:F0F1-type ATP synthase assembly protein I
MVHHPDRGGAPGKMQELCEAVEMLADPATRLLYDRSRADPHNALVRSEWESAAAANARATRPIPERPADFKQWLDSISNDVQKTTRGRVLSGLVAGLLVGAIIGWIAALFLHLLPLAGALIGGITAAAAGAIAAASNGPVVTRVNRAPRYPMQSTE